MATTTEDTGGRFATGSDARMRAGGGGLAVGSLLFVLGLVLHPPPSPDPAEFMATIAEDPTRWVVAHGATAVALSVFAIAGLIVLTSRSRLTRHWWTTTAWAGLVVTSLWVTTAAVAEATVITRAAVTGETATFETWSVFAEAHSAAFVFLALAIAVIAGNEARSTRETTPAWGAWLGAIAGVVAALAFVAGLGLGIALGSIVWLVAAIAMSLWTLWFGVALARTSDAAWTEREEAEPGGQEAVR